MLLDSQPSTESISFEPMAKSRSSLDIYPFLKKNVQLLFFRSAIFTSNCPVSSNILRIQPKKCKQIIHFSNRLTQSSVLNGLKKQINIARKLIRYNDWAENQCKKQPKKNLDLEMRGAQYCRYALYFIWPVLTRFLSY